LLKNLAEKLGLFVVEGFFFFLFINLNSAPLSKSIAQFFRVIMGCELIEGYFCFQN
jgi:hypothetical protein